MVHIEDVNKGRYLIAVDEVIKKKNSFNKDTANFKVRIIGLHGEYIEAGMTRIGRGYELSENISINDFIAGVSSGEYYVINPSFLKKYYKQKWFQEVLGLL